MAVAGDVVIKLAADVADLKSGLDDANKRLDELNQHAADMGGKMEGAFSAISSGLKGLGLAAIATAAIEQIKQLMDASEKAALSAEKMAQQYKLTSEQVQALQRISDQTGTSMSDLAKIGKANEDWLKNVTDNARNAGLVIGSEYTSKLKELADQADDTNRRLAVLFAPAQTAVKSWIADSLEAAANNLKAIAANEGILDKIIALLTLSQSGGGVAGSRANIVSSLERAQDTLKSDIEAYQTQLSSGRRLTPEETINYTNQLAAAQKKLVDNEHQLNLLRGQQVEGSPVIQEVPAVPVTVKATRLGGGGGRTDDENIQSQIDRYKALGVAATTAYEDIRNRHLPLVEDIQRELKVQQDIEQIAARLGARYKDADESLKKQLHDAVEGWERAKEASAEYVRQVQAAEDVEARFGDGSVARARANRELERARAGGADPQALARAAKQRKEATDQEILTNQRYSDSVENIGQGFQAAALRWSRSNDLFSTGEQAFGGFVNALSEGFDTLAGKSNKTFGDIAADFAEMLAKMALQAAASQVFKTLFGAVSVGGGGQQFGPPAPAVTATARAGGGDVYPGQVYRVGEYGPETFVPTAAGRIQPMASNGNSVSVSVGDINVTTSAGGKVGPRQALDLGRKVKQAVVDVIQNEKRPGGSLYGR